MTVGQHQTRDDRVAENFLAAIADLQRPEPQSPVGTLTPEDEAMLRELEQSDGAFIDQLVDDLWGKANWPFGPYVSNDPAEKRSLSEPAQRPCHPAEKIARDIVRDWAWEMSDSDQGVPGPGGLCWEHFPRHCQATYYALLVKALDLDSAARPAWCRVTAPACPPNYGRVDCNLYLNDDLGWRSRWPLDFDAGAYFLALGLAPQRESEPSRLWRMIDELARTFRVETYDRENMLRILLGNLGKRILFAGLTEPRFPGDRLDDSWNVCDFLKDIGTSFIDYFREWSGAVTASYRQHRPNRLTSNVFLDAHAIAGGAWVGRPTPSSTGRHESVEPSSFTHLETREAPMPKMTFYPLDNADTILIDLANGKKVLFDYADMRTDDEDDKKINLRDTLWKDLKDAKRNGYDVFAVTHLDNDHTARADEYFYLDHAKKYQEGDRAKIRTLWVPAGLIFESRNELQPGGRAIQAEARHRLTEGYGIRVFSRPQVLKDWLEARGIRVADREHVITDAGNLGPELSLSADGVEFFVHSPFAWRQDEEDVIDRNANSLVMQATFSVNSVVTRAILGSDVKHEDLTLIVKTTRRHRRESRLLWDIFKLPHHCSYLTLGPVQGEDKTEPVEDVRWLFEEQARRGCMVVSTSKPIPEEGTEADKSTQPPHRQAAKYYRDVVVADGRDGEFRVTMQHPKISAPKPLVIEIDGLGHRVKKEQVIGAAAVASTSAPRAG